MRELARQDWKRTCDRLSRQLASRVVEIPLDGLPLESPAATSHSRLLGLIYDPPGHTFQFSTMAVDHWIEDPTSVTLALRDGHVVGVEVRDEQGNTHRVTFSEPLALDG